ncbi:MAG TPA: ABC transporter permease [Candidatus Fusicatenibacter intestinigallinarum]|uniref:ABC transporter permease n=1 Tax=Candidatus Fusicatenibacter intestinigallinarum TaxID=2838598 RepID=A0A9D2NCM2_9FIRM|nr:ABC transporter permease [Candidatus Fusicatenibacter intestinigallinarum]
MLENIRLSFQGIWSHKMRSFLTMLGIIIGIASIISIVSTIKGTNEQIKQNLIGAGNNNVKIQLYQGEGTYWMDGGIPSGVYQLSSSQKEEILGLDEVENASFYQERTYASGIAYGSTNLEGGNVMGVDANYMATCGYQIYQGRMFLDSDFEQMRKVVLLDDTAAQAIFQDENPLGKVIEIINEPFTVVGVVKKSDSFQPVIQSMEDYNNYSQESYATVFLPNTCWPIVYQFDEPENAVVMARSTEDMSAAGRKTADIMNRSITNTTDSLSYKAEDLLERARNLQELSESTNSQLIWIASISLLVGGIGVMNIMLVSVTERTSEIGLKKAIGARKRRILAQFLTEAAVLTSIGGLIGVGVGIVMAQVISRMSKTPVAISVPAILFSVAFSMIIGIVFGLLPSVKAANLNPIDALRRE